MIYPMFGMVLLTFSVLVIAFGQRVRAVRSRQIRIKYFRSMQAEQVPEHIIIGTRHFANLFEMPVLFYGVCLVILTLHIETQMLVGLGWAFVFFRVVHSIIHLTYNNVVHRMTAFFISNGFLLTLWILVATKAST